MKRIASILRGWPESLRWLIFGTKEEDKKRPSIDESILEVHPVVTDEICPKEYTNEELEKILKEWAMVSAHCQQEYNIEMLAKGCQLPIVTVKAYFKDATTVSFRTWRLAMKLETAKIMLLEKEALRISEVSGRVGFSNRSNFYRQFRKYVGCTPNQWRSCQGNLDFL